MHYQQATTAAFRGCCWWFLPTGCGCISHVWLMAKQCFPPHSTSCAPCPAWASTRQVPLRRLLTTCPIPLLTAMCIGCWPVCMTAIRRSTHRQARNCFINWQKSCWNANIRASLTRQSWSSAPCIACHNHRIAATARYKCTVRRMPPVQPSCYLFASRVPHSGIAGSPIQYIYNSQKSEVRCQSFASDYAHSESSAVARAVLCRAD